MKNGQMKRLYKSEGKINKYLVKKFDDLEFIAMYYCGQRSLLAALFMAEASVDPKEEFLLLKFASEVVKYAFMGSAGEQTTVDQLLGLDTLMLVSRNSGFYFMNVQQKATAIDEANELDFENHVTICENAIDKLVSTLKADSAWAWLT
ncbi:hypothetical protein Ciccas_004642 [Cichlidogyrus casuarinus]|uniref:HEPN domain-containing protein n=1 Tax=Cichlidogyrus casuarinus TaxID=1844966 RepID=A0ABD2QBT2_9PLAT